MLSLRVFYVSTNSLHGPLPTELGNLEQLFDFSVSENYFTGPLPTHRGRRKIWRHLIEFVPWPTPTENGILNQTWISHGNLSFNAFTGLLPTQLWLTSGLTDFDVRNNQFSGTLATAIGNLTQWTTFYASGNTLTGPLPTQLGLLIQLTDLDLGSNHFNHTLPFQLGQLTNLMTLDVSKTNISGTVQSELCNMISGSIYFCEPLICGCNNCNVSQC